MRYQARHSVCGQVAQQLRHDILSKEDVSALARRARNGDSVARDELVMHNQRLVAKVVEQMAGYGLPTADLIQEGNIGLLQAIASYDPDRAAFTTYAIPWIRASLRDYVFKNLRLVRVSTSHDRRMLFYKLRAELDVAACTSEQIAAVAAKFNVSREDVEDVVAYFRGADISVVSPDEGAEVDIFSVIPSSDDGLEDELAEEEGSKNSLARLKAALDTLSERSKAIIVERHLVECDDRKTTLRELADRFNISLERVRQLEAAALAQLSSVLTREVA